jgi:hypothetical protein
MCFVMPTSFGVGLVVHQQRPTKKEKKKKKKKKEGPLLSS